MTWEHVLCFPGMNFAFPAESQSAFRRHLQSRERKSIVAAGRPRAAVLVGFYGLSSERLLYTVRTQRVGLHKGEVSFPGGMCEAEDGDPTGTALREAFEEIGLDPADVDVLGLLDDAETGTNVVITPVVARIKRTPYPFATQPAEVERLLEVPVEHLLDRRNRVELPGRPGMPAYVSEGQTIWGATARVTVGLLSTLGAALTQPPAAVR